MKKNKNIKCTFLMIAIISLSLLITSAIIVSRAGDNSLRTSYINKDEWSFIETDFYKSYRFDEIILPNILKAIEVELYGENDESNDIYYYTKEDLSNIKYIGVDKNTGRYVTNTSYNNIKDFEKNIDGYVNISFNKNEDTYIKEVGNKENKINTNYYYGYIPDINKNMELCLSIPKNLENTGVVYSEYDYYNTEIKVIKAYVFVAILSAIVFIASTILYKFTKGEAIKKDSKILKLYNKIPVEVLIIVLLFLLCGMWDWSSYGYMDTFVVFLLEFSTFIWIISIVLFIKKIKYLDHKIEIIKSSILLTSILRIRETIAESLKASKKILLIKRIFFIGVCCIAMNILSYILFGGLSLIVSCLIIAGFTSYILKRLAYLSEIIEGAEKIKSGNLDYKIPVRSNDNFTALAENINNIGQGLEKSIEGALKSERMKAELITNVSHDLKTPLTSIINYVQLIKKEDNIEPEYIKDYIKVLDLKSRRLKILIEDLFEASKASSGNIELNMEKIELRQLLRQCIGEMEEKLLETRLEIKLNMPDNNVYIYADGRRMFRVLENLLSNIIKYSLNGTRVYIDLSVNDGKVLLIMKNISSYELNFDPVEIMERFKRADKSRNTEGSGLGLAIAKDLVSLQGGIFNIEIDGDLFKSILEFNEMN